MSMFTKSLIVLAVLGAIYVVGLFTSKTIETEIKISAAPEDIWKILTNTDVYSDWNPFMKSIEGDLNVGNQITATIQVADGSPMTFTPTILVADEASELRWLGRLGIKGIFDGEHYFILEKQDDNSTIFRHGEVFSGILAFPLLAFIGSDTKAGFETMNDALKKRAEAQN